MDENTGNLSQLTLEEKISLLAAKDWWRTPTIRRDNVFVPHIKMSDGPNGARGESYVSGITAACFPCSTCVGATFDVGQAFRLGQEIAKETISKSAKVLLAPTMNIIRSPLGGRNYETFSEDPLVIGTLAAAFVRGCQDKGIAATPKHFVANDSEKRRTKMTTQVDERTLREIYLRPFQIVMRDSDPWCFMTSYNRVNGEYCAESHRLLDTVLRKEWGFSGVVVSDWMGTYSTAKALEAGLDLEMPGPTRWRGQKLLEAIEKGELAVDVIDNSVKRILNLAHKIGCFKDPEEKPEISAVDQDRDDFIADLAAEGIVVLKNENNILPISRKATVAVIGHHAENPTIGGGGSAKVLAQHIVSPLEALKAQGIECRHAAGVPVYAALPHGKPEPPGVLLEWFNGTQVGMNKVHSQTIPLPEYMIKEAWPTFLDATYCTRMTFTLTPITSGTHTFSVITTGAATVYINDAEVFHRTQEPALLPESFYFYKSKIERRFTVPMTSNTPYKISITSQATDPAVLAKISGTMFQGSSLRFAEYHDEALAISTAASLASQSDVALVFVGTTNEIESEGYDRTTLSLPSAQNALVTAVAAANKNTVVVNFSGSPVDVTPFLAHIPAFVQAWFPGQECGHSVAKVLLGDVNPSGRMPMSWPKRDEDNPAYANFPCDDNDVYYTVDGMPVPQFWFGEGLSYTTFEISAFRVVSAAFEGGPESACVRLACDVENTGQRDGKQVVQIYVSAASSADERESDRPGKELRSYKKVFVEAGTKESVEFVLDKYAFSFWDEGVGKWRVKKGEFLIEAGFSAQKGEAEVCVLVEEEGEGTWSGV
ncbi:glycoside hydrolase family 3 protein [Periconia macrospinosa]|uniref:beta-glucosidase n=1 Tax=Periconia macrospinosa TaxID=97972 RepID=A0A2V1DXC7_9PLEO|nr:glycoside hydrolase family 3 protein [Periconia macrospinosa]